MLVVKQHVDAAKNAGLAVRRQHVSKFSNFENAAKSNHASARALDTAL